MKRISSKALALFFRQLSVLQGSGVLLHHALEFLEEGEENPAFRFVLDDMGTSLVKGRYLSEAMRLHPEVFPRLYIELVAVGEQTGGMVRCLHYLADLQARREESRQRVKAALTYPFFLFLTMVLVTLLFVLFVAPGDGGLFAALGKDIPWISRLLVAFSKLLTDPKLVLLTAALAVGAGLLFLRLLRNSPQFRLSLHSSVLSIPVLGPLVIRLQTAVILDVITACLRVGLSPLSAVENAGRACSHLSFRAGLGRAHTDLMHGESLAQSLDRHLLLPGYVVALIEVGEVSGSLVYLLEKASEMVDEEAQDTLDRLISLLEPALLVLGGVMAGAVTIATFLPVVRLLATF